MVFDKRFDGILWLMLSSDKENRDYLARMIASIPQEAYEKVHLMMSDYDCFSEGRQFCQFTGNNLYFNAAVADNQLNLRLSMWNEKEEENFYLTLMGISEDDLSMMGQFRKRYVGSFEYNGSEFLSRDSIETDNYWEIERMYELRKTPVGYCMEYLCSSVDNISGLGIANVRKIPDKMYPHQFDGGKKFKRLMKGRKRKKY